MPMQTGNTDYITSECYISFWALVSVQVFEDSFHWWSFTGGISTLVLGGSLALVEHHIWKTTIGGTLETLTLF